MDNLTAPIKHVLSVPGELHVQSRWNGLLARLRSKGSSSSRVSDTGSGPAVPSMSVSDDNIDLLESTSDLSATIQPLESLPGAAASSSSTTSSNAAASATATSPRVSKSQSQSQVTPRKKSSKRHHKDAAVPSISTGDSNVSSPSDLAMLVSPKATGDNSVTIVLHIHGGGWVSQSPETHLCYLQPWAAITGLPILSVAYKLSPASEYPQAINECFTVYKWLLNYANLEKLGIPANGTDCRADRAHSIPLTSICSA